nr:decaprenyl-phosphate phosphoribosyltransferase [Maliibacterium massiliense]
MRGKIKNYIKLMRPKHYVKNVLLLIPLFFSGEVLKPRSILAAALGLAAFSLAASAIYIYNDIHDVGRDRMHEVKKNRPIASGAVSIAEAYALCAVLFVVALACNYFAAPSAVFPWVYLLLYILVNFAYSMGMKNMPIVDVAILASGFLLRVLYGSALVNVGVSTWLYLTIMMFSFYMGLSKRRNELLKQGDEGHTRKVLQFYSYHFLDINMYMCLTLTLVFYSLWTVDASTMARVGGNQLLWTVPLVIIICLKYNLIIDGNSHGDPVDVLLSDKVLIGLVVFYALVTGVLYYGATLLRMWG